MVSEEQVRSVLKTVDDPEIGINIVDLGLVYRVDVLKTGRVVITMTLTTPTCPLGPMIDGEVRKKLKTIGVEDVLVDFVATPPWDPSKMSEEAKLELGYSG